ncbi:hypothetical protein GCM10023328_10110 [Modestobacter marinus]|uniref:Uncharacterized protein n=1 Tax=Modestobacter marinus TaxID=477641 RepID=A0A846M2R9_9ACTN|nr:hypothetical protein [Modestobacter marinus]NIH69939.1 hypothetical protein [Modestobacter marinus]GGL82543.1 hypothetical protein GCM10011589_43740 [Modestobacter marinus]
MPENSSSGRGRHRKDPANFRERLPDVDLEVATKTLVLISKALALGNQVAAVLGQHDDPTQWAGSTVVMLVLSAGNALVCRLRRQSN